jgi:hypothetical protein
MQVPKPPAASFTTSGRPVTGSGLGKRGVLGSRLRRTSSPQQEMLPPSRSAHVCAHPARTSMASSRPVTRAGAALMNSVPCPSCPVSPPRYSAICLSAVGMQSPGERGGGEAPSPKQTLVSISWKRARPA